MDKTQEEIHAEYLKYTLLAKELDDFVSLEKKSKLSFDAKDMVFLAVNDAPKKSYWTTTEPMTYINDVLTKYMAWKIKNEDPWEEVISPSEELQTSVVRKTQMRLDEFARTKKYDSILSACTYVTSANPTFSHDGQRAVELRDNTWTKLYEIMHQVESGARPIPNSFEDIEPELPILVW